MSSDKLSDVKEKEKKNNQCSRCGYSWKQRKKIQKPKECPECKSRYWNEPA